MKYKRVFAPNKSSKLNESDLFLIADEVIFVCQKPMYDNLVDEKYSPIFEDTIVEKMADFNPEEDVLVYFGDSLIFAMIVMHLTETFYEFDIARYSRDQKNYVIRRLSSDKLLPKDGWEGE